MKNLILMLFLASAVFPQQDTIRPEYSDVSNFSLDSLLTTPVKSASKYWQDIMDAPSSVSIITAQNIKDYGYKTLYDALQNVRGFYLSNDRNYSYLGVRGFSRPTDYNDRILVLINGQRLNENVYGSSDFGNGNYPDLSTIEQIEIVRGPGSVLYGNNAMFAVINLIPKSGADISALNINAEFGSWQNKKITMSYGKEFKNGLDLLFSANAGGIKGDNLYYPEFNSDSNNRGIAQNLDGERYFGLYSNIVKNDFRLSAYYTSRRKDIPTASYGTVFNKLSYSNDANGFIDFSYDHETSYGIKYLARFFYSYYKYDGFYSYTDYNNSDQSIGHWFGVEYQILWDLGSNNRFTAGFEINHNPMATYKSWYSPSTTIFNGNFPFTTYSVYVQDDYKPFRNVSVIPGLSANQYSGRHVHFSPRLALIYKPTGNSSLKYLYGEAFRFPNVYENNYYDPASNFIKSVSLNPEEIETHELSFEKTMGNFYGIASLYRNQVIGLIDTQVNPDSSLQFVNVSKVLTYGFEFRIDFTIRKYFMAFINYAWQQSRDAEKKLISNSPAHILNIGSSVNILQNLSVAPVLHFESERKTVYDTYSKPFLLTDLNINYSFNDEKIGLSLKFNNLFDVSWYVPGGYEHIQPAIQQDGRKYILSINFSL
jgi:outer membrane receptor for ferrienterochelin and colicins